MSDSDEERRIGSGPFRVEADEPSPEWFPQLVTPENFVHYWNDVHGLRRRQLANYWLTVGFDSERLRWLATLDDHSVQLLTTEQIIAVLHSLAVPFEMPEEFLSRCARAIAKVQVDLDATGLARYLAATGRRLAHRWIRSWTTRGWCAPRRSLLSTP